MAALVVGDDSNFHSARDQVSRRFHQSCRFPCSEKTTHACDSHHFYLHLDPDFIPRMGWSTGGSILAIRTARCATYEMLRPSIPQTYVNISLLWYTVGRM